MFLSVLDLFKIGIGPSSSHTMGPMLAACEFIERVATLPAEKRQGASLRCILKGSLSATGKGHATDKAVLLGVHGYRPADLIDENLDSLVSRLFDTTEIPVGATPIAFQPERDILFDPGQPLPQHPNGMIFELRDRTKQVLVSETCFSIGGGFIEKADAIDQLVAPLPMKEMKSCPFPFDSAQAMLKMARQSGLSIAAMKRRNETAFIDETELDAGLDAIWQAMQSCLDQGLNSSGRLPGGLNILRRAQSLHQRLLAQSGQAETNDWLCAYALAVNEQNAAGQMVVTAPTNGAAGVIPAVLNHLVEHQHANQQQIRDFLLTASAIGGLIKHRSSISGAEVGCQGEVGSAAAMAAAGLCAVRGGSPEQIEHAAEIALEHHLGLTCDPVQGLVQVPCIERNGFGAIKAYAAASLALHDSGQHFMSLDQCIAAMKQTGEEMSIKFKETSLGGLAVAITEC